MRSIRFTVYFALGAFLVMLALIVSLIVQEAPGQPNVPFMGTMIDTRNYDSIVYLPNRLFTCSDQNQQFRCEATLQDRLLQVTLDHGKDYIYNLKNCRATYDGQPVHCEPGLGGYMTNRGILSYYVFDDTLGLSADQLLVLQRSYWLTNRIGIGAEGYLWLVGLGVASVGAVLAIALNWLDDNLFTRCLTSLSSGFLTALVLWYVLAGIPYDLAGRYGMSEEIWNRLLPVVVIGVGIGSTILMSLYTHQRTQGVWKGMTAVLMAIASGTVAWAIAPLLIPLLTPAVPEGTLLRFGLTLSISTGTACLLWKGTRRSRQLFSCSISALGVWAMLATLIFHLTLTLGYPD